MYNIDFYETIDGFSDVKEFLDSLRTKARPLKMHGFNLIMEHMSFFIIFKRNLRRHHAEKSSKLNQR